MVFLVQKWKNQNILSPSWRAIKCWSENSFETSATALRHWHDKEPSDRTRKIKKDTPKRVLQQQIKTMPNSKMILVEEWKRNQEITFVQKKGSTTAGRFLKMKQSEFLAGNFRKIIFHGTHKFNNSSSLSHFRCLKFPVKNPKHAHVRFSSIPNRTSKILKLLKT